MPTWLDLHHITGEADWAVEGSLYHDAPALSLPELEYLDPEVLETIDDCNFLPDQIMVMDAKELHKTWVIKSPLFKDEAKCEGCYQFKILDIVCDCKKVKCMPEL